MKDKYGEKTVTSLIKPVPIKRFGKTDRERKVLLGLVDCYINNGRPVGSNTLKETGFEDLSSATIRNYFANLEEAGFLVQTHTSGGRIPTPKAYRTYAQEYVDDEHAHSSTFDVFNSIQAFESREVASLLQDSAELLSRATNCAVFLSAPRFDHDYVIDLKLVPIDSRRCLCVIITDFGVIRTEVLQLPTKLSSFAIKRIESYFHWRLSGLNKPENLELEEEAIAQNFYNELMVRYIVGYSNFIDEEIYRTGFSLLLGYPEFQDASAFATSLSLFENAHSMRLLLKECTVHNNLKFWIGDDLAPFATNATPNCTIIAIPYYINKSPVGAVGILGPTRMPYKRLFHILRTFSTLTSEALTRNLYKYKISFRQPQKGQLYLQNQEHQLIGQSRLMLLEDKRRKKQ